ncbi:PAS domain-containing protein [Spirosoma taeanense]|uniref:histidine kinase n=1 Tax=Spirosoma taeanense TaxID=2735870 RepID=A0A6M5YB16_9BACT|nr:PAS domain S-box protein [Spirosoma taeanense]QJW90072.1 PAS domain-containing protein [Spirosoma taeanense]
MIGPHTPLNQDSDAEIERLKFALQAAGIGTWDLDPIRQIVRWDDRCKELYGFSKDDVVPYNQVLTYMHPDDRVRVHAAVQQALRPQSDGQYDIEFRTIGAEDDRVRWLRCQGKAYFNEQGLAYRFSGIAQEVTQEVMHRRQRQELTNLLQSVLDSSAAGISVLKSIRNEQHKLVDFEYQLVNRVTGQITNRHDLVGQRYSAVLADFQQQDLFQTLKEVIDTGDTRQIDIHFTNEGVSRWFAATVVKLDDGAVVSVTDITQHVEARQALEASEARFRSLIEEASVATCLFIGRDMRIDVANEIMLGFWGKDRSVIGQPLQQAVPELVGQPFLQILDEVFTTGEPYEARAARAELKVNGVLGTYYFDFTYKPLRNAEGEIYGIMDTAVDVTEQVVARRAIEASEAKLRSVIATAPAAMGLFVGRDLIVELPNQAFIDIVGKGPNISGKPLREVMPELESQPFLQILDDVYTSGSMFQSFGTQVNIVQHGVMTHNFYNITYTPLFDAEGKVYAILDIAIDVTEEIKARHRLEESELFSRSIIENAPVAKLVLVGEDMLIKTANENMLAILGRDAAIIGQPFGEAMPELNATPLHERLRHVFTSGETHYQPEEQIILNRYGQPYTGYFNYIYKALRNTAGELYGVLVTAIEVTEQVVARQKVEATQADLAEATRRLSLALEAGRLGSYDLDLATNQMTCTARCKANFGLAPEVTFNFDDLIQAIVPDDRPKVQKQIHQAIGTRTPYYAEYRVIWPDGTLHWVKAAGLVIDSDEGQPARIIGVTQDITARRMAQEELERQVQLRTQQLRASVQDLQRSNENLQQFAYIASHDLQEPLRKIQSFGDILRSQYAVQLGEGVDHLQRMQSAASRMSILIRDLLSFSRISTRQEASAPVSLTDVVHTVLTDLDLTIQETGAVVSLEPLPTVQGDPSQLGQLFQNLLSNALKFRQPGVSPVIEVSAGQVTTDELPASVQPARQTDFYHRIDVSDNGIGFNEKYIDRIFQVFQRLHGKNEFAGTGIGLAICEKVAINHGGAITASSQPGQGATFSVYLPVTRMEA